MELSSIYGNITKIPIINPAHESTSVESVESFDSKLSSVNIPFMSNDALITSSNESKEIELFFCFLCFDQVEYAFKTSYGETWFCSDCLKQLFDPKARYIVQCNKCTRKMKSICDNFSNEIDISQ